MSTVLSIMNYKLDETMPWLVQQVLVEVEVSAQLLADFVLLGGASQQGLLDSDFLDLDG